MNADELKMILDTINAVSGNASNAAVWWMALHYGTKVLVCALLVGGVLLLVRAVTKLLRDQAAIEAKQRRRSEVTEEWASLGRKVAKAWGSRHALTFTVENDDYAAINRAVEAALKEKNHD